MKLKITTPVGLETPVGLDPEATLSQKGAIRSHACFRTSVPTGAREPVVHPSLFVTDLPIPQDAAIGSHYELG